MGRQPTVPTILECTICGNKLQIWRKMAKQHTKGHTKHMWCPYCQNVVAFTELRDGLTKDSWVSLDGNVETAEYTEPVPIKKKNASCEPDSELEQEEVIV